jgi:hypothetical protein
MVYKGILWYFFVPMVYSFFRMLLPKQTIEYQIFQTTKANKGISKDQRIPKDSRTQGPRNIIAEKEKRKREEKRTKKKD